MFTLSWIIATKVTIKSFFTTSKPLSIPKGKYYKRQFTIHGSIVKEILYSINKYFPLIKLEKKNQFIIKCSTF